MVELIRARSSTATWLWWAVRAESCTLPAMTVTSIVSNTETHSTTIMTEPRWPSFNKLIANLHYGVLPGDCCQSRPRPYRTAPQTRAGLCGVHWRECAPRLPAAGCARHRHPQERTGCGPQAAT